MFNATYFTYDGIFSGGYGLKIADFNDKFTSETAAFSPVLKTTRPSGLNRAFHNGIVYENPPQYQFSIISESFIPDIIRREILSWLVGKKEYKILQIHQQDLEDYYYNCVFTNVDIIYVGGRCHGFRITANFDSPYARGEASVVKVEAGEHKVTIENKSDIFDDYVYPIVQFSGEQVDIVNETDNPDRHFKFSGLFPQETITVDNEIKFISSNYGGEKLGNFDGKNWLRLKPGYNELNIISDGEVIITCPHYVMIGF